MNHLTTPSPPFAPSRSLSVDSPAFTLSFALNSREAAFDHVPQGVRRRQGGEQLESGRDDDGNGDVARLDCLAAIDDALGDAREGTSSDSNVECVDTGRQEFPARERSLARSLTVTVLSAALLLVSATACGEWFGGKPVPQGSADRASPQSIETEQKRVAAKRAIADYEYAQRNELVEDMKAHLSDMQVEVDAIEAKLATATGDAKAEIEVKLVALRKRWDASKKELAAVEAAGEADWEIVKARFAKAYDDLDSSVDDARQWVSDRIEP